MISLVLVLGAMLMLSWQITLVALVLVPMFVLPAKWVGRRLPGLTREQMQLNAEMGSHDDRAVQRRRRDAGQAVRPARTRGVAAFAGQARRVRDIGVTSAMYGPVFFAALTLVAALATALVYGVGGMLAVDGAFELGTLVALAALLTRLYGPLTALSNVQVDVMTALVSFERVFEVLDLKPMVAEKAGRRRPMPRRRRPRVELDDVAVHATRRPTRCRWPRWSRSRATDTGAEREVLHGVDLPRPSPGELVALVGPSGAGKTTITQLVSRLYDVDERRGADRRRRTCATSRWTRCATRSAWSRRTPTCSTTRSGPTCATPARTRPRRRSGTALRAAQIADLVERAARRAGHRRRRPRLPAVRRGEAAAGHRAAAAQGAARGRARRGDRAPGLRVRGRPCSGRWRPRWPGRTSLVIAHRLSTVRERRPDPGGRGRPGRRARAGTRSCWPRAASTPSSTAPSSRPPAPEEPGEHRRALRRAPRPSPPRASGDASGDPARPERKLGVGGRDVAEARSSSGRPSPPARRPRRAAGCARRRPSARSCRQGDLGDPRPRKSESPSAASAGEETRSS